MTEGIPTTDTAALIHQKNIELSAAQHADQCTIAWRKIERILERWGGSPLRVLLQFPDDTREDVMIDVLIPHEQVSGFANSLQRMLLDAMVRWVEVARGDHL